jgi:pimeloyl-ACP methyl ester carboxylesterase
MAVVDRPGYGASGAGQAAALAAQATRMLPVLEALGGGKPVCVMGHSYGGPVALWLAVHYPELVRAALLLHPVVDPNTMTFQWLRDTGKAVWPMLPGLLRVSTVEMNALPSDLAQLAQNAAQLRVPVRLVQGMRDWLAPPAHANFAEKHYPARFMTIERLPKGGHLTPFLQKPFVVDRLLGLLQTETAPR